MIIIARNQNNLLKELFHIINGSPENPQKVLSIRLGEKYSSFAITDKSGNELYELAYCSTEGWNENSLHEFFTSYPLLRNSFYQSVVAYDTPQSILTPSSFYKPGEAQVLLKIMQEIPVGSHIISELISEWQLYNTYAVTSEVHKWVNQKLPAARSWHQYSLAIKKINAAGNEGSLAVDFRQNDFTVIVARQSRILLAQTFEYTTHEDVLYYLLKTCHQFSLSQKEVNLEL